jgi:hypothetical protein
VSSVEFYAHQLNLFVRFRESEKMKKKPSCSGSLKAEEATWSGLWSALVGLALPAVRAVWAGLMQGSPCGAYSIMKQHEKYE